MRKRRNRHVTNHHHLVPRSRCRAWGITPEFYGNVVVVNMFKHQAWHTLFENATPEEAIEIIKSEWSLCPAGKKALAEELKKK